jgi:hypothetical protein
VAPERGAVGLLVAACVLSSLLAFCARRLSAAFFPVACALLLFFSPCGLASPPATQAHWQWHCHWPSCDQRPRSDSNRQAEKGTTGRGRGTAQARRGKSGGARLLPLVAVAASGCAGGGTSGFAWPRPSVSSHCRWRGIGKRQTNAAGVHECRQRATVLFCSLQSLRT